MDKLIANILDVLRTGQMLDAPHLDKIIRQRSSEAHDGRRVFAKKHILPYYLKQRSVAGAVWETWAVDDELNERFIKTLQMKPRRSASGVATITVITKPWGCANNCVYCPNDPRMPKSYLSDEPACQRAERNGFNPYLQVASRLRTLDQMGHATDKIELIVLGGTWFDYPEAYRTWFIHELFRSLNDDDATRNETLDKALSEEVEMEELCDSISSDAVSHQQHVNENARHRVVGLVVETRPDTITTSRLTELRRLGCTKIQLGVQSVDDGLLACNGRKETSHDIERAFTLCRLFGFKIHAHFMVNLLGATPDSDIRDYKVFATGPGFQPDEVKLYPCALVEGTQLVECYRNGTWAPYSEEELVHVLSSNLLDTPPFIRVSRMIRDISAKDILAGNKKTNLRQIVESHLDKLCADVQEIRYRELGTQSVSLDELQLQEVTYRTDGTTEHFLQWVTPENKIAGFLRLSLPKQKAIESLGSDSPVGLDEAMIREVHVYGFATKINRQGDSAQHHGLGRMLIDRACEIAHEAGYARMNVISAIGTREYYRKCGFTDNGLYQQRVL